MPTMPSLIGLNLSESQSTLQSVGVLNPNAIGYFGTWPITVEYVPAAIFGTLFTADSILITADSPMPVDVYVIPNAPGVVIDQSINAGTIVAQNASLQLTLIESPLGQVYP